MELCDPRVAQSRYQGVYYTERDILCTHLTGNFVLLGKYDLKWRFYERQEDGEEREVSCMLFTIKIV